MNVYSQVKPEAFKNTFSPLGMNGCPKRPEGKTQFSFTRKKICILKDVS